MVLRYILHLQKSKNMTPHIGFNQNPGYKGCIEKKYIIQSVYCYTLCLKVICN